MKNFANHAVSRRAFLGGSAAAAALGLAACGGNSGSDAKTDAGTTTGGKEGGGTLTVGSAYSPSSYDPANCSSAFCFSANMNVMEGIYTTNLHDYSISDGVCVGDPVWIDDTHAEITMRDGAAFSDGTPITAEDIVFSFGRATAEGGLYVSFLTPIAGIEKKDDKTLTVEVTIPQFSLLKDRLAIVKIMPQTLSPEGAAIRPAFGTPRRSP